MKDRFIWRRSIEIRAESRDLLWRSFKRLRYVCYFIDFHEQLIQKKDNFVIFLTFSLDKEFLPKLLKNHQAIREDLGWSSMWFWAMASRTRKLTELINNWIEVCVSDAPWLNSLKSLKNNLILPRIQFLCPLLSSSVGGVVEGTKVCDFIDSSHSWNGEEKRNREKNCLRILSCPALWNYNVFYSCKSTYRVVEAVKSLNNLSDASCLSGDIFSFVR